MWRPRKSILTSVSALLALYGVAWLALGHEVDPPTDPPTGGQALSQVPCENGFADVFPCSNVDLLSFMPIDEFAAGQLNDLWGWTDEPTGDEYVILGLEDGVGFVDATDPENPVYLGLLPSQTSPSFWNDIKVYDDYAFVVSEAPGHGMQVFDLTRLPAVVVPPVTFGSDAHYGNFGDAHNIFNLVAGARQQAGRYLASDGTDVVQP